MIAGVLELQILAGIGKLSDDMKKAERIVGDSTSRMEKSVTSLQNQFSKLGMGLSFGLMIDQIRRLSDSYVKVTAQMRIATAGQAEYAKGMEDVRRISTAAQAGIEATTMLYTRLTNSLKQHGATQQDVGRITESVSLGLKAYGATTAEAASAMLQLSQAFGSGRLGGEEFRAVSEAMPNMMVHLAKSMGVPKSALRDLSMQGKITSEVMMKAWNDPALIAGLTKQAEMTRTITGEWFVLRNNLTMLVGEFMGASGSTNGITASIKMLSDSVVLLAENMKTLITLATVMGVAFAGKHLVVYASGLMLSIDKTIALAEATAVNTRINAINAFSIEASAAATIASNRASIADAVSKLAEADAIGLVSVAHYNQTRAAEANIVAKMAERGAIMGNLAAIGSEAAVINATIASKGAAVSKALIAERVAILERRALAKIELADIEASIAAHQVQAAANVAAEQRMTAAMAQRTAMQARLVALDEAQVIAETQLAAATTRTAAAQTAASTSAVTGIMAIGVALRTAIMAHPIIAATTAIAAIVVAIANWDTIVKSSKASLKWFQNEFLGGMEFLAAGVGISLGELVQKLSLLATVTVPQLKSGEFKKQWDELGKLAEQSRIEAAARIAGIDKQTVDHEKLAAAERHAADRKDWEKATNTKAQQRQAEIAALNEQYLKIVDGQEMTSAVMLAEAERYNVALANINEKYGKAAAKAAAKELSEAMKASAKLYEEDVKARQQYADTLNNETRSIEEKTIAVLLETESIGKTKAEIDLLQAARYDHETQIMKETLATYESAVACTVEAEALKEAIAAREAYKKAQTDQSTKRANQAAIDAETKSWGDMWKKVDGFAHDAFDNIFDKGKNAFEEIGKVIKKSILDMLYRMTVQRWLFNIGVAGGGTMASGAAQAFGTSGSGGMGDWLSVGNMIKDGFTGLSASFTTLAGNISGGLQAIGVEAGTAGSIGIAGAYAGAGLAGIGLGTMIAGDKVLFGMDGKTASMVGSAIGLVLSPMFGPLGVLAGGVIGGALNAAFGMGAKKAGTTTLVGQFGGEGFAGQYQTPWSQKGGWFRSNRSGVDTQGIGAEQQAALNNVVMGTKSVFDNLVMASGDAEKSISGWTFAINRQVSTQEQQNQLIIDMAESMGSYMIPALEKFRKKGENLADTAVRLTDEIIVLNSFYNALGTTTRATMDSADALATALGGVANEANLMTSFISTFASESTQTQLTLEALKNAGLGMAELLTTTEAWWEFSKTASIEQLAVILANQGSINAWVQANEKALKAQADANDKATQAIKANIKALQDKAKSDFDAARQATDSLRAFALSVRELQRSLWAGSQTPLSSTYDVTRSQFAATNVLAGQGDANAQANLAGAATAFLDASKKQATSAIEYARDFALVQNALSETAYKTEVTVTVAEAQLTVMELIHKAITEGNAQSLAALMSVQSEINLAKLAGTLDVDTLRGVVTATTDKQISSVDTMNQSVLRITDPSGALIAASNAIQTEVINNAGYTAKVTDTLNAGTNPILDEMTVWLSSLNTQSGIQTQSLSYLLMSAIASSDAAAKAATNQIAAPDQLTAQALVAIQTAQAQAEAAMAKAQAFAAQSIAQIQAQSAAAIAQAQAQMAATSSAPAAAVATQTGPTMAMLKKRAALEEWERLVALGKSLNPLDYSGKIQVEMAVNVAQATYRNLPAFAIGTNEVPFDMTARIHKGEEIKPRAYVEQDKAEREETNNLLREMKKELTLIKTTNYRMSLIEDKWDNEGLPLERAA